MRHFDYVVVGSGIAGLYTAILASEAGSVLVLTKGSLEECNTQHAQGGIAAAIGPGDSPELHARDTVGAGAGLGDDSAVRILTEEAADRIADLIRFGVPFDTQYGEIALAKEGAHSAARVLHAGGDATGRHIELSLSQTALRRKVPIQEHAVVTEALLANGGVAGVRALDARNGGTEEIGCRYLVLATGGAGQLYQVTTNSGVVTGDGVALAFRAGAQVMDMEFFQFHPTALRLPGCPAFLISEAVRGEGGILRNSEGRAFMADYTPQRELAPRDVVARAIVAEMSKTEAGHVFLDVRHIPARTVTGRFPQIYQFCLAQGLDITKELVPVSPAAHYMMGGVKTNAWGETNVRGVLAAGETACTGAHGANRLASNSLLETMVFSKRLVDRTCGIAAGAGVPTDGRAEELRRLPQRDVAPQRYPGAGLAALQRLMWEYVGIVRSGEGLTRAVETLAAWRQAMHPAADRASSDLRNAILTATLIAEAALARQESRGAHYRSDFPEPSSVWQKHLVFALK